MSIFHFLKFLMNFLKGVVSICHSLRSMGQPGRINGFDRCFQVVALCTAPSTPVLSNTNFKVLSAPYGETKALQGNF